MLFPFCLCAHAALSFLPTPYAYRSRSLSIPTAYPSPNKMSSSAPTASLSADSIAQARSQQQQQRQHQREAAEQQASREDRHAADSISAAAASFPRLSTAQRFHTDGLHCIFAFLQLKELPSTAAVCLDLQRAVQGAFSLSRD